MPKSIKRLAQDALDVQDACNLSGVAFSFANAMKDLCEHKNALGKGTEWINHHPITIMWVNKLESLANSNGYRVFAPAYEEVRKMAERPEDWVYGDEDA